MPDIKPTIVIGFEVASENVHDVTGYCAAEMAIEQANARGDLPVMVDLVPIVDERDPEVARRAAAVFVEREEAVAVLGPTNSAIAVITQEIYHHAGLLQLTSEASSPLLTERGFQNFFRLVANDLHQGRALAQVAVNYLAAERIAILHEASAWGAPIARIVREEVNNLGKTPALVYGFGERENQLDFDALIEATLEAKPDLVYFAIYWNLSHIIAHRLRDRGLTATFLGSDALKPYAFLEVPSLDTVKPYHTLAGIDMRIKPSARPFLESFAQRYPVMLAAPQYAAEAYDCAAILLEAIRRAPTVNRAHVLDQMQHLRTFSGALGDIRFDDHGDLIDPEIGLYQCIDGQRKYLGAVKDLVA
jgi:branched-chain amino acid transport system substrate-binding protein